MQHPTIAHRIIELQNNDLALRDRLVKEGRLSEGYDEEIRDLHIYHATILDEIIKEIGFPTIEKVGKEANGAAWLVIQHAIEKPSFMKKCIQLLELAVNEEKASEINLAYLKDRVAILEGNPQLFGTQFDWDENGVLSPNFFDSLSKVNKRRKSIGLNTLEEQTAIIRKRAMEEHQTAPTDFNQRKNEINEWKKKVGWIK